MGSIVLGNVEIDKWAAFPIQSKTLKEEKLEGFSHTRGVYRQSNT